MEDLVGMMYEFTTPRRRAAARNEQELPGNDTQGAVAVAEPENTGISLVRFLTSADVARLLGCSTRTIHRLVDAGRIPPPVRLGGLARWSRAAIEAWIAQGCPPCRKPQRR